MTPELLRAMADEMEAKTPGITANEHERALEKIWEGAAPTGDEPKRPGYMRTVDVDGITVDVDMRVVATSGPSASSRRSTRAVPTRCRTSCASSTASSASSRTGLSTRSAMMTGSAPPSDSLSSVSHLLSEVGAKN